ncbi:hypothetical protein [Streptomyces anulatus]|uniref:hypothetical protein n=2 Tax=Streptomyces TaxID=1883 RepID=UPI0011126AA8|nr:hypothetical protein [Streptomyces anulatus]WTD29707.1 hypothetical protein OH737_36575 [Streptomyces anulatus]
MSSMLGRTDSSAPLENALDSAVACARSMLADDAVQPGKRETREEREARNNRLVGARLVANNSVNLLAPVLLNACRKASEKRTLTDLESELLDLTRLAAPTPEDVAGYGRAFTGLEAEQRAALFPAHTARHLDGRTSAPQLAGELRRPLDPFAARSAGRAAGLRPGPGTSGTCTSRACQVRAAVPPAGCSLRFSRRCRGGRKRA